MLSTDNINIQCMVTEVDPGVGNTGHFTPPPQAQWLPPCTSDLPFDQRVQKRYKVSGDLATISMISDERTIIFRLGIVIHHETAKVGMVNCLRMQFA